MLGRCPKCKKIAKLETTTIRVKLSAIEVKQREIVKIMVKDLLGSRTPLIKFPATSAPEINCQHCGLSEKTWGWTSQRGKKFIINFPRQSFFLSRDQFVDTIAHEPSHVLIGLEKMTLYLRNTAKNDTFNIGKIEINSSKNIKSLLILPFFYLLDIARVMITFIPPLMRLNTKKWQRKKDSKKDNRFSIFYFTE